jgi:hypothetical protein
MLYIYHHIYPSTSGHIIKEEQKNRIYEKIDIEFTYIENIVELDKNEWPTIIKLYNDAKKYNDDDIILYIHTKGAVNNFIYNKEWRDFMETELIDNYSFYLDKIKIGFNTSGCLMGIPHWSPTFYGGNFWYMQCKYLKTIKYNDNWNFKNRYEPELDFIQRGIDWKPYTNPIIVLNDWPTFNQTIYEQSHYNIKTSRIKLV